MKHKHTKPQPSWLLQGLMIRAGLYDPLPPVPPAQVAAVKSGAYAHAARSAGKSWIKKAYDKFKAAFVYDPDRT